MQVKVSPKYQVVIPEEVRHTVGIRSGEMLQVIAYENRIELIPVRPMKAMKGFLKGMSSDVLREKDRI